MLITGSVMKQRITATVQDLVQDLLVHDRREDDRLLLGEIEAALATGEITKDDMVKAFSSELTKSLPV